MVTQKAALARKSLGWMTLEVRRAQMKAKLMYKKTLYVPFSQRLCEILKNVNEIHSCKLRGSSAKKRHIAGPKTQF